MQIHPIDSHVGKRLRARRLILNISQESLGNAVGVSFQQVQKYERGINRIGASRLYDFAEALSIDVSYFFDGLEPSVSPRPSIVSSSSPLTIEEWTDRNATQLVRYFNAIENEAIKKKLLAFVKSLSKMND